MLSEFVQRIVDLANDARKPAVVTIDREPRNVYFLENAQGQLVRQVAQNQPRLHQASDLSAVMAWANRYPEGSVVWFSRHIVTAFLDDDARWDMVCFKPVLSPQFQTLQSLESKPCWIKQPDFVRLLRIGLNGTLQKAGNLLDCAREVKFIQNAEGAGSIQHGRASIGKKVSAQLDGSDRFPDQVVLSVPVFANLPLPSMDVLCALDIDAQHEQFLLQPMPNELEVSCRAAEMLIQSRLASGLGHERIYYGQP